MKEHFYIKKCKFVTKDFKIKSLTRKFDVYARFEMGAGLTACADLFFWISPTHNIRI